MYDFHHKLLPISFHSIFKYNHEIQSRLTRQSHLFHVERCQFAFSSNLPLYAFPKISNKYSKCVSNIISRSLYKEQLKNHFVKKYNSTIKCTNNYCNDCRQKWMKQITEISIIFVLHSYLHIYNRWHARMCWLFWCSHKIPLFLFMARRLCVPSLASYVLPQCMHETYLRSGLNETYLGSGLNEFVRD